MRNFLASSMELTRLSSNTDQLIVSSGAQSPLECRSPADVANLAKLIGVPAHKCHRLTNQNAACLLRKTAVRTGTYKGVISGTTEQLIDQSEDAIKEKTALQKLRMHESVIMTTEECSEVRRTKKRVSDVTGSLSKKLKSDD